MFYRSTRGTSETDNLDFADILLTGLAKDGGLFMPLHWPHIPSETLHSWRLLSYPQLATEIISLFTAGSIPKEILATLCENAYKNFSHKAITPLCEIEEGLFSLELFHGPTLAFKDMAMQMLGQLFEYILKQKKHHITIVGATSGDTGSAAIEAFKGRENISVVILHPHNRTSEVQRRQMTTVTDENVLNIAIEGDFDDCQDMVKAMFTDAEFRQEISLSAVNSINWARIVAQIPYYIRAALVLGAPEREVSFAVPTGNFGNILAAWAASQMGLPVRYLCVGSNRNDILTRFLTENDMSIHKVAPSLSPSMDIQVSSNFERLLFEMLGRDANRCAAIMQEFRQTGRMAVPHDAWSAIGKHFRAHKLSDDETLHAMKHFMQESDYLADPHTAIGLATGAKYKEPGVPMIVASTAHPAKFPKAVKEATALHPSLPPHLADLYQREEHYDVLPCDLERVKNIIRLHHKKNKA